MSNSDSEPESRFLTTRASKEGAAEENHTQKVVATALKSRTSLTLIREFRPTNPAPTAWIRTLIRPLMHLTVARMATKYVAQFLWSHDQNQWSLRAVQSLRRTVNPGNDVVSLTAAAHRTKRKGGIEMHTWLLQSA